MKKIIDIGANLTDLMYKGIYNGSKKHSSDLENVLERSWAAGLEKIIITGGSLEDSKLALDLAKTDDRLYSTVGCHPTRCQEFEKNGTPEDYLEKLEQLAIEGKGKVIAIGECGLDYDRLEFCGKDLQLKYFEWQLTLSSRLNLPLFLHCRNAASDLIDILKKHTSLKGVVHSFDGTKDDVAHFIDMGLYIGINGCSLKTADNLSTMSMIPTDRLMIETDCPWCEVRPTHSGNNYIQTRFPSIKKEKWSADSMVKGRNEPCNIIQILEIMSAVRNEDIDDLANKIYENTVKLFFSKQN